ncbi:hypothetical protein [Oleiphilus messinensis]|nr:hypothetical protein [Oleiphilus messinensis]
MDSVLQDLINNPFANNTGNGFASTMFFDALSGSVLEGMQLESSNSTLITRASAVAVSAPGTLSIFLLAMFGLFGLRTQKI